jgi:formylglycine-generating enzyme required for sulfatase activity
LSGAGDSGASELTDEQWRRLEDLLADALASPADQRAAWVRRACVDDPAVRAELESLLAAHETAGPLDRPLGHLADHITEPGAPSLATGTVVSHYQIEDRLGSGGMGVVYRARDLRLGRTVALKFLPAALSGDARAKRRFMTEASAAAALDHVNVCTVHEIGETDDGRLFIAMAYVDGESLRDLLERGPLPVARAVEIAVQIAAGLARAHEHGVVHRDVKPANVMVGRDGVVKLVDFGVAKLMGATVTHAGSMPGTAAYMSPEQVQGEAVDHRTDLWSLGVVLHEMLAGERPFRGDTDMATLHAITTSAPPRLRAVREGILPALDRLVARALEKRPDDRFGSAREIQDALAGAEEGRGVGLAPATGVRTRRRWLVPLVAVGVPLLLASTVTGIHTWRDLQRERVLGSLDRIEGLAEAGAYVDAYDLAVRAEGWLPTDTTLQRLMTRVADRITVTSEPPGARVWLRRVLDDGSLAPDSMFVGATPVRDLRVARADYRVRVAKDGYDPAERIASSAFNRAEVSMGVPAEVVMDVRLLEAGRAPAGMLFVPGSEYTPVGREAPSRATLVLADYVLDATEVTNEQFRAFIAAGGYDTPRWWRHPFVLGGREISWSEAMERLVDRTGLSGPRDWVSQEYPAGEGKHPVTGVTWYEAAAYAAFVGKRLPTLFEWEKAARDGRQTHFEQIAMPWGVVIPGREVAGRANFSGEGTVPVGRHAAGISPHGVYDMAGNAEEWIANTSGDDRFITGGAWDDPMYIFSNYAVVSPFHSSPSLGFRCARDAAEGAGDQGGFDLPLRDRTPEYRPVDDATFQSFLHHYAYDQSPLEATVRERVTTADWTRETIDIAGPWEDPTTLYLYLPARGSRPLQTLLFVPGSNVFYGIGAAEETERVVGPHVKAGRAVATVLLKGMRGRPWDAARTPPAPSSVQFRREMVLHATELRRGLDYLETRGEFDASRFAFVSLSLGAGSRLPFAAVDPRFRSVVLIGGGIDERMQPTLPEANSINFAPRIGAPTLLVNGRWDEEHPWYARGLPLWNLLPEPKRLVLLEGGHLPPAEERVPVINAWLDETLGPVGR